MLQTQTVEPHTFSLLNQLMAIPQLEEFCLVGGTALSLKYGHRKSIDLDLFSENNFENEKIITILRNEFGDNYQLESDINRFGIFCYLNGIKVDIVKHQHPLIGEVETIDGIRMYSTPDIAAMKIKAILGRGKKKDFFDLYELLDHYSFDEINKFYEAKFSEHRLLISIPEAVLYFDDANDSENPDSLKKLTWNKVKKGIEKKVRDYLK